MRALDKTAEISNIFFWKLLLDKGSLEISEYTCDLTRPHVASRDMHTDSVSSLLEVLEKRIADLDARPLLVGHFGGDGGVPLSCSPTKKSRGK